MKKHNVCEPLYYRGTWYQKGNHTVNSLAWNNSRYVCFYITQELGSSKHSQQPSMKQHKVCEPLHYTGTWYQKENHTVNSPESHYTRSRVNC